MVQKMGLFDEWQAQKDSQYILVTEYIEHLAREHSSSLFATVEYLQVNFSELKIYSKSFAGKFCIANTSLDNGFQRDFNAETVFIYIKDFLSINKKVDTLTFKENTTKFSHYYFKKSELPVIEPVKPSEPQASEINSQITLLQRDPLLTSLDDYSILEASCLISGDDFLEIERCYNDTNFDKNYAEYLRAERLISAGIKAKVLDLTRPSLQKFLKEKGYIIAGFNDKLPLAPADKIGHATITQTMPTDSQLSQKVADLNAQLASATDTIASLQEKLQQNNFDRLESYNFHIAELHRVKTELNQYQKENESLKAKIAELQANEPSQSDTVSNDKLLSNVELNNLKKAVIAENNRQIATVLKSLDCLGLLSKDDLLQVIRPNMESMAKVLNGENSYKALLVVDNTIKDNHLKSLSFQTGRKTKEQTEKKSIQLIFDRKKPPITEN